MTYIEYGQFKDAIDHKGLCKFISKDIKWSETKSLTTIYYYWWEEGSPMVPGGEDQKHAMGWN